MSEREKLTEQLAAIQSLRAEEVAEFKDRTLDPLDRDIRRLKRKLKRCSS